MKINNELLIDMDNLVENEKSASKRLEELQRIQNNIKELKELESALKSELEGEGVEKFVVFENNSPKYSLSISKSSFNKATTDYNEVIKSLQQKYNISDKEVETVVEFYTTNKEVKSTRFVWGKK
ncbi:MAG: hypothetical protein ACRC63_00285 [Metamycoplasmataceae bacterium]